MYQKFIWSIKVFFMEVRFGRHCLFLLHAHLVFVTKYRKAIFTHEMLSSLEGYFRKICLDFQCELTEFNGEKDHVHLLINYPPKVSLSKLVNSLKETPHNSFTRFSAKIFKLR